MFKHIYRLLLVGCLTMTAISTFSNGWSIVKYQNSNYYNTKDTYTTAANLGIMDFACYSNSDLIDCKTWWTKEGHWLKNVIALMCCALAMQIIYLVVDFSVCYDADSPSDANTDCGAWYRRIVVSLMAAFLMIAIILYGINYNFYNNQYPYSRMKIELGWSFALAATALGCAALSVLVSCCSKLGGGDRTTVLNEHL